MTRLVACPIALHPDGAPPRIPVFEHPQTGTQIINGGLRDGETPQTGAARELFEEASLETRAALYLGSCDVIETDAIWHFSLCRLAPPVREVWQHYSKDDGGHLFTFAWLALDDFAALPAPYSNAVSWMKDAL